MKILKNRIKFNKQIPMDNSNVLDVICKDYVFTHFDYTQITKQRYQNKQDKPRIKTDEQ